MRAALYRADGVPGRGRPATRRASCVRTILSNRRGPARSSSTATWRTAPWRAPHLYRRRHRFGGANGYYDRPGGDGHLARRGPTRRGDRRSTSACSPSAPTSGGSIRRGHDRESLAHVYGYRDRARGAVDRRLPRHHDRADRGDGRGDRAGRDADGNHCVEPCRSGGTR
jgi:hypothetical protein